LSLLISFWILVAVFAVLGQVLFVVMDVALVRHYGPPRPFAQVLAIVIDVRWSLYGQRDPHEGPSIGLRLSRCWLPNFSVIAGELRLVVIDVALIRVCDSARSLFKSRRS